MLVRVDQKGASLLESQATLAALVTFAAVTSVTPGPNNLMILASSAAFGWRRTLPHLAGIALGYSLMLGAVVLGFGALLDRYPEALFALRTIGAAWLFWLAWQLARPALRREPQQAAGEVPRTRPRPMTAVEAALFQWVNPKAWTMAAGASAAFSGIADDAVERAAVMVLTFLVVGPICLGLWMFAGHGLKALLFNESLARPVALCMAALVAMTALFIAIPI
jgi:threonine/homoserine/homoserine lactone efflux protein